MSKIEVDAIVPQSGTTLTVGESGDTITVPTGATFDASNATTTLPATVVTTDGSQTLTNKTIDASQLTGTITPSDGTVTTAKLASEAVTPAKLGYDYNQYRNIIINGDMSIAQRGTSTASVTTTGYYACDRWDFAIASMGTFTISQDTDVPTGQGFAKSFKVDCTTADASPSANDLIILDQRIEGQNLQYLKKGTANAESLTVSFWVKSNKTGTYTLELQDRDNNRTISKTYTIDSSNTWEKKTLTFAGDTTGAFDNDNARSLDINWWLGAGSTYSSGTLATSWQAISAGDRVPSNQINIADNTANNFWITGVQLEAGTVASDFEFLPFDVNLQRCQRYFETSFQIGTAPAEGLSYTLAGIYGGLTAYTVGNARIDFFYKTTKRAIPTLTFYNVTGLGTGTTTGRWQIYDTTWSQSTGAVIVGQSFHKFINIDIADSYTVGNAYLAGGGLTADAEL